MKVVHISKKDHGGAGNAALRLHLGLKSLGIDSKLLVLDKTSSDNDVVAAKDVLKRMHLKKSSKHYLHPQGHDLFSGDGSDYCISSHALVRQADIINLHWVARMVDLKEFFSNVRSKPIVWSMHDKNPFTGGCHYNAGCMRYRKGCGKCPQLSSRDLADASSEIFEHKKTVYDERAVCFVASSKALLDCARKSPLLKNHAIETIPYGLPAAMFQRHNKLKSRSFLRLPRNEKIILYGAAYDTPNKGFEFLIKALKILCEKKNTPIFSLVLFGFVPKKNLSPLVKKIKIYELGFIPLEQILSFIYSSADVTVSPSLDEAFGWIPLESMFCKTPVVSFGAGIAREIIINGETGFIAHTKDEYDLALKIRYLLTHNLERERMAKNAWYRVQKFTNEIMAGNYLKLYKKLLTT